MIDFQSARIQNYSNTLVLLPSIDLHVCSLGTGLRQRWRSRWSRVSAYVFPQSTSNWIVKDRILSPRRSTSVPISRENLRKSWHIWCSNSPNSLYILQPEVHLALFRSTCFYGCFMIQDSPVFASLSTCISANYTHFCLVSVSSL